MAPNRTQNDAFYTHIFSKFAHAVFDEDLQFVSASDNFAQLTQIKGSCIKPCIKLTELFNEFVGAEDEIEKLIDNPGSFYSLNRINRPLLGSEDTTPNHNASGDNSPEDDSLEDDLTYINLVVRPIPEKNSYMLIVENVTDEGRLEQRLTQARNELDLAKDELDEQNQILQQTNERLVRVNQLKEIFFSMVAHDLRSPLSIISGYANLLKNTLATLQETAAEHIETIRVQSRWLDNSINNMLDLHKIDSEQLTLERETSDLCEVVEETVSFFQPMATLNQLTLSLDLPDEPIYVSADVKRLKQVLQNLLSNAIKYNEPVVGRIDVKVQAVPEYGDVEIIVADTGKGMTDIQLKNAFQLYYRTEEAESSEVKGTGIGLYIVKMLMEAHDGRVKAESALGEGTTFHIWLKQIKKE